MPIPPKSPGLPKSPGVHRRAPVASRERPTVGALAWVALGVAAVLLGVSAWIALAPSGEPYDERPESHSSSSQPPSEGRRGSPSRRFPWSVGRRGGEPRPPPSAAEPAADASGLALFPPPGTDPPKRGIVVPDDFELPPGYVRHYQATDSGERLPAILMFHPDYRPVDADGVPLPLPPDRIVPPELAPLGLPVRMLEMPAEAPEAP